MGVAQKVTAATQHQQTLKKQKMNLDGRVKHKWDQVRDKFIFTS